ncbi:MAG: hypothetical protein IK104_10470 [Clostridia bacterium]|nr:hypothetical protein [Clostridia bacterium]
MKEEYKNIFDSVTPDEVLLEGLEKKPSRKRLLKPAVALMLAAALVCGILLYNGPLHPTTETTQNGQENVRNTAGHSRMLLYAGAEELPVAEKEADIRTFSAPINYKLRVFSLNGLSESERQALIEEKRAEFSVLVSEPVSFDEDEAESHEIHESESEEPLYVLPFATEMLFDDVYVVIEAGDAFTIRVPEATKLVNVTANCGSGMFLWFETCKENCVFRAFNTLQCEGLDSGWSAGSEERAYDENGNLVVTNTESAVFSDGNRNMTVEGSFYKAADGCIKVLWFPSEALIRSLVGQDGGEPDYSSLSDSITFTAQFNDGATETCGAVLTFDRDGHMRVTVG